MFAAGFSFKESQPSTSSSSIEWSQPCHHFKFDEIVLATNNFDEALVIGHGGFGKVYKGNLINGSSHVVAAIKRLDSMSGQGAAEFWAEIETLSYLRHCNLVSLFGYCNYDKEMILVYEYVPNRTLADHLHKLGTPLSWLQRLKICIGAGRGLHYLHTGAGNEVGVIHRDVKTSNILLNESWAAKISDFGLSKIGPTNQPLTYVDTRVKGTFGYLDPDYSFTGRLTRKSDVYAFGVILLEVLCRKPALDLSLDDEEQNLARWAQEFIKEGKLKHIIDSGIRDQISTKCLKEFVRIAGGCLNSKQKQRPTMAEVVFNLESILDLQEKMKSLLHPPRRTIFGRLVDKLPFTSNVESSGTTIVSLPSNRGNSGISNFTGSSHLCRQFKFHEILLATDNFDESLVIGRGRFGKVYKGNIMNGSNPVVAALKRLDPMCRQGASEFWAEVEMLSRFHHCNLASLIGYCNDEKEMILIYEYISKGTLSDHLHKLATPLSWLQRLEICIDVARGLDYLHTGDMGIDFIIHRNVKTSEILLHESWAAKISGFGLSKRVPTNQLSVFADLTYVSTSIKGTFGYLDPDYFFTGRLTRKTDVYAFGVVLLEVLCRKRAIGTSLDEVGGLARWAQDYIKEGNLKHIIDSDISDQISSKCLKKFVQIAEGCLHNNPKQRPTMAEVVVNLESILTLQEKMNSSLQLSRRTIFGGMAQH